MMSRICAARFTVYLLVLMFLSGITSASVPAWAENAQSGGPFTSSCFPRQVTDHLGRQVTITAPPARIVSLAPSNTEMVYAVGMGHAVVGVTDYCDYPPEVSAVTRVGGYANPSLEKVVSLHPDLVLAGSNHTEILDQLGNLGLTTIVVDSRNLDGVLQSLRLIGRATGADEMAAQLIDELEVELRKLQDKVGTIADKDRVTVYYEVWADPLMSAGLGSFIHDLIIMAGGINVAGEAEKAYPKLSPEAVIKANPDVILFPTYHGTGAQTVDSISGRPGWGTVAAIRNGRIYGIDGNLVSRPGPRIVACLKAFIRVLYPELLPEQ